jgi:signal transduction histidine kinase
LAPTFADVELRTVFDALRGTMRALVANPDVDVVVEEPTEVSRLYTDEVLLTQILRNLLTNGIKFTHRGEVRLSARPSDDNTVDLVVSDTGIGIPADEQGRVFEAFYQIRGATPDGVAGTGLGLPYARRLATLLGGHLTLTSTVGVGSTFTVTLPHRAGAG